MPDYDRYARIDRGTVVVRYSLYDAWGTHGWPPSLAREYAQHIITLADEAERTSPKVVQLIDVLNDGPDDETMEDLALRLIRAGYRRKP